MKKKTKTVIGVILAVALVAVLVVVGFMTYLGITWTNNHEFGEYVSKEGPWGMTAIAAVISFAKRRMMNHLPRLQSIFRGWMVGKPMNCMAETGLLI
mgnify:CR=1 FL=1